MANILPIIIVLIAVGGSGFAAMTLRGGDAPSKEASYGGDHGKAGGGVHDVSAKGEDKVVTGYYKFQRDFIVPVMRKDYVDAVVLISFSVEMNEDEIEKIRPKEPRFRDAFMKTLLGLSHSGLFDSDITAPDVYDTLQSSLSETASSVMGEAAQGIVIVDFARQDR
ncbi:MAG: hypothetical protein AAF986_09175 [Pseudomonadota bacterium]